MPERRSWHDGWWAGAQACASPHFGPRLAGVEVGLAVVHAISLPPGQFQGDAVRRFFTGTLDFNAHAYYDGIRGLQVSAHFWVRRQGRLLQFVSCDQRAWHAGASSWRGRDNCNDWSLGIELEGLDGLDFTPKQYLVLGRLLRVLSQRYPLLEVVGHEHIAPGRKADPGPGFDWHRLRCEMQRASTRPCSGFRPKVPVIGGP